MEIKLGRNAGFCFGVKRAVDAVTDLAKKGGARIRTVGDLIADVLPEGAILGEPVTQLSAADVLMSEEAKTTDALAEKQI